MTLLEAIDIRTSQRKYEKTSVAQTSIDAIEALINEYHSEAGVDIRLNINNGDAFDNMKLTNNMFSNIQNYIGMIYNPEKENALEKLGYYGELLVLHATALGLGTCWVAGSVDLSVCPFELVNGQKVASIIVFGNGDIAEQKKLNDELTGFKTTNKTKNLDEQFISTGEMPEWFMTGMNAVGKAPSAKNLRIIKFINDNGVVTAQLPDKNEDKTTAGIEVDLGITKLHFELGAGRGKWPWGDLAAFKY